MKKILLLGLIVGMSAFLCAAGLRLGMTGAVKEKVKELDKKVREKKAETTVQPPATQTLQTLSGTAAKGAAIASKAVVAKSTEGYTATGTTDATGKFTVDITSMSLPVLLKVTDGTATYFSVANASGTCNIHPFTDMVVRTYFKSTKNVSDVKDAFDNNFVSLGTLPAKETIDTIKSVVATVVSSVLERNGIDPLSYDMFTTPFDANSSGFDKALEQTQITFGSDYSYSVIKDTTTGIVISTVAPTANDITAPDAPTNVAATGISGTSIKLSWTASPGTDIAGYAIYRDGVKIANVSYTTYLDVGLPAGVPGGIQYGYTIEAYDWAGKKSAKTTAVSCATLTEFAITATGKFDGVPATAFDGTNYLMAYGIRDSTNAPYNLEATFVLGSGSAGTLLSFDVLGSTHGGGIDVASIAYGSTSNKYLMVFRSTETCNWPTVGTNYGNLYGIFITPAGVKSSPVLISTAPSAGRPAIASDGTNYLITWSDFRNTGDNRDIYGRMIAPDGSLIGSEIAIATAPYTQGQTELRYTGSKYLATWSDGRRHALNPGTNNYNSADVYARFINTDGSLGYEILIDSSDYASDNPSFIAFDNVNNKCFVAYHDAIEVYSSSTIWKCYGRFMDNNGNVSPAFTISDRPLSQFLPIPCFDGTKYLVTWVDGYGTENVTARARFFDTNGNKLGNEITLLTKKGSENYIMAWPFFGGSKYFLSVLRANTDGSWVFSNGDIYGMFFTP